MMKGLVLQQSQPSQTPEVCFQCHALDRTLSTCPYFARHSASGQEQVNMAYQRPKNDLYAPTFNPGWYTHPKFSWSNDLMWWSLINTEGCLQTPPKPCQGLITKVFQIGLGNQFLLPWNLMPNKIFAWQAVYSSMAVQVRIQARKVHSRVCRSSMTMRWRQK